jgi:hypothetical protein
MYGFDEQRWDGQQAEVSNDTDRVDGWLIQNGSVHRRADFLDSQRIYLQIGTGQWCTRKYATLFPTKSAAIAYARKFGYTVGQTAQIVRCRF